MKKIKLEELFPGISGAVGKKVVFKQYKGKTIVTKYPKKSQVKPTQLQEEKRKIFADAVAYAKGISNDPIKREEYLKKVKKGESVYQFAMKEYYAGLKK